MKPSKLKLQALFTLVLSAFFLVPMTLAAPLISFNPVPDAEFKVYEGTEYSAIVNVADIKQPTLVHMYVAGPVGALTAKEYLVQSHTYEEAGDDLFTWDGMIDGKYLPAGKYELRFKSGGLYLDDKSALIHKFNLTDPFQVIPTDDSGTGGTGTGDTGTGGTGTGDGGTGGTGAGAGTGKEGDNKDIEFNVTTTEPICAELRVDGIFYKFYEALKTGDQKVDIDELIAASKLAAGSHEWKLYADSLKCGGTAEKERVIASGQFTVAASETDYSVFCGQFSDIEPDDKDCPAIGYVYSIGAMTGYPDGTFRASKILQRDESAKISLKAFKLFVDGTDYCKGTSPYPDITLAGPEADWSAQYVCRGTQEGTITGYKGGEDAGKFIPDRLVNIAEFLALILRNLDETMPADSSSSYTNVPSGQWYSGFFKFAQTNSLIDLLDVAPTDDVSRREVAKILYKLHLKEML